MILDNERQRELIMLGLNAFTQQGIKGNLQDVAKVIADTLAVREAVEIAVVAADMPKPKKEKVKIEHIVPEKK